MRYRGHPARYRKHAPPCAAECVAVLCFVLFSSDKLISVCMLGFVLAAPGSYLDKFFNKTKTKTPEEIAQYLEEDDEVICLDQVGVVRSRTGFSCVIADE